MKSPPTAGSTGPTPGGNRRGRETVYLPSRADGSKRAARRIRSLPVEPWDRRAMVLLVAVVVTVSACGSGSSNSGIQSRGRPRAARRRGPPAGRDGRTRWTCRCGARAGCRAPSTPSSTASGTPPRSEQHQWQLGYAWLEEGQLVHVIFEGYAARDVPAAPARAASPASAARRRSPRRSPATSCTGSTTTRPRTPATSRRCSASGGNTYVVSIHVVSPVSTKADRQARPAPHHRSRARLLKPA